MPRNSDFEYSGLNVEHADNWNAIDYHKPKSASKEQKEGGFQPVKGMVSPRTRRVHNDVSPEHQEETTRAAMKDWRQRGLSNSEIIDY